MCCKLVGSVLVIFGCLYLGIGIAGNMRGRIRQLIELERIINYIEGEISYKHSLLGEACMNASKACGQPFHNWLKSLSLVLMRSGEAEGNFCEDYSQGEFCHIWSNSLEQLRGASLLKNEDIDQLDNVGQALSQPDIKTKEGALKLEKELIHSRIEGLSRDLNSRMKSSVILCFLGGIMTVIVLL